MDTNSDPHFRTWAVIIAMAAITAAIALSSISLLSGLRVSWFDGCHMVQITLSQDALKSITAKIVELSEVVGSVFDELIDHVEIPRTFTMYTVRYCTEKQTGEGPPTLQCFPFGPSRFDIVAGAPYAICIVSSLVGLSLLFPFLNNRYQNTKRWYWIMSCHWVAFLAISFASVLPTVLAYTSHAIFAESLPLEIFSLEVGGKFLALTWSAWMSSSLALMIVQRIRHIHLQS